MASLSRLFSNKDVPYLPYRAVENIFCKAFNVDNLSRDDLAYDAKVGSIAWGIKTFASEYKKSQQKISEFNVNNQELKKLKGEELVARIAELRNERIIFANKNYKIDKAYYHCVVRQKNVLKIFEEPYEFIDINKITNIRSTNPSISFKDNNNEYSFNFSKSTLLKKFYTPENTLDIDVEIIDSPLELLDEIIRQLSEFRKPVQENFVILPLYSTRSRDQKTIPERSGLNQWNAGGRERDYGEVYIPIPQNIHKKYPNFFPNRNVSFNLIVPSGEILSAKVCQDNSKALMTNPNNALSEWMLRDVLRLQEGELLTYKKLLTLGIDSMKVVKVDKENYKINFSKIGSYEEFINHER